MDINRQEPSSMKLSTILCRAAIVAVALGVNARADYSDDFSSGSLANYDLYQPLFPFGAGGSYVTGSGNLSITAPQSPNPGALGPGRAASFISGQSYQNFTVSYDLTVSGSSTKQFVGAFVQVTNPGLGTLNGYAVGIDFSTDQLFISKVTGENSKGSIAPTAASSALALDLSGVYHVDYTTIFGQQSATLTDKKTGAVIASVYGTDTSYTSGAVGLGLSLQTTTPGVSASATFDNLTVTSVPEPTAWILASLGLGSLAIDSRRRKS